MPSNNKSTKLRQFSIVLHNVREDSKPAIESFVSTFEPMSSVVALEPYPDQEGHHCHIFIKFRHSRGFRSTLQHFEMFSKSVLDPKPEGEERSWGRVQVDQMRGTFEQATAYLTNPKKDKPVDPNVVLHSKPDPFEEVKRRISNEHLRRYYGTFHFPDVGLKLQGFQYVELLLSQSKPVSSEWMSTYNFISALEA